MKAEIAQMVEHGTENPRVTSSILVLGTAYKKKQKSFYFITDT